MADIYNEIFGITPRKKKVDGNRKGGKNERELCKALSAWTGFEFNRVPKSGALRWKNAEGIVGDVVPEDKSFPFTIETKFYKNFEIKDNLRSNSIIFTFWEQAQTDANRYFESTGKTVHPLLFVRKNDMGANWWVFCRPTVYQAFLKEGLKDPDGIGAAAANKPLLYGVHSSNIFALDYKKIEPYFLQLSK